MILIHQVQEPIKKLLAFLLGNPVNVAHVTPYGEDALPPGYWVRPDGGVDRPENLPDVLRGATRLFVELEPIALRRGGESGLVEGDG